MPPAAALRSRQRPRRLAARGCSVPHLERNDFEPAKSAGAERARKCEVAAHLAVHQHQPVRRPARDRPPPRRRRITSGVALRRLGAGEPDQDGADVEEAHAGHRSTKDHEVCGVVDDAKTAQGVAGAQAAENVAARRIARVQRNAHLPPAAAADRNGKIIAPARPVGRELENVEPRQARQPVAIEEVGEGRIKLAVILHHTGKIRSRFGDPLDREAVARGRGDLACRQRIAEQQIIRPRHDAVQLRLAQLLAVDRLDPRERHVQRVELLRHGDEALGCSLKADDEDRDRAHGRDLVPLRFKLVKSDDR
jgi:hypothetical protein